jgi:hypothetical protein
MKKRVMSLLLSVSVWLPLLAIVAQAQYAVKIIKVEVPFDFNVRGRQFPAGAYIVRREGAFLSLRNDDGRLLSVLVAHPTVSRTAPSRSKLVFFDYKGMHLLTQILWEGDTTGAELAGKGREVEVARRIAPAKVESAEVSGSRP